MPRLPVFFALVGVNVLLALSTIAEHHANEAQRVQMRKQLAQCEKLEAADAELRQYARQLEAADANLRKADGNLKQQCDGLSAADARLKALLDRAMAAVGTATSNQELLRKAVYTCVADGWKGDSKVTLVGK